MTIKQNINRRTSRGIGNLPIRIVKKWRGYSVDTIIAPVAVLREQLLRKGIAVLANPITEKTSNPVNAEPESIPDDIKHSKKKKQKDELGE